MLQKTIILLFPLILFSQVDSDTEAQFVFKMNGVEFGSGVFNQGCFDDNYTIEVGMSLYDSTIINCNDALSYLNNFGYGCNTPLSEINNPFWGSNPNETIANICGCTCEDIVTQIYGCLDEGACNYNPEATQEDGSCEYPIDYYDCDGICLNDIDGDGICDEDDDCIGQFDECGVCNGNGPISGYDCDGNCLNDLDNDGICDGDCVDFDYLVVDCECSFIDPATYTVFFTNVDEENCLIIEDCYCECINDFDGDGICDENEQAGCTDPNACNYDSSVISGGFDDGSCLYPGDECVAGILEGGELVYGIYNTNCLCVETVSLIPENTNKKELIKVIDFLGRSVTERGRFIIKIYNNGTINKELSNEF